jgi:23S rRNA pseudouridine2605 synthase
MPEERLQKVLAQAGISSRRKAEEIIAAGRVTVNGRVVREMGVKVDPGRDRVTVDGIDAELTPREYWLLHKPVGVITTVDDPWGRPTARSMVPTAARVFPVGRLDADSSGLVLFTNDGELAYRLMHPRFEHGKTYRVRVAGRPDAEDLRRLRRGMRLDGRHTAPAEVAMLETTNGDTWLEMVLHEGRKRQIRRMLSEIGHPVQALVRVQVGALELGDLPPGKARRLTPEERLALKALVNGQNGPRPLDQARSDQRQLAPAG